MPQPLKQSLHQTDRRLKTQPKLTQLEEELEIHLLVGELCTSTWYMGHHHVWPPSNHIIYLVSQEPPHSIEHSLLPEIRSSIHLKS